jgi:predicted HAD superfamily Cof-like phosphohydrolase
MGDHFHYASDIHGAAEEHHRHYDHEQNERDLRSELDGLRHRVSDLEEEVAELRRWVRKDLQELRGLIPDPLNAEKAEAANRAREEGHEEPLGPDHYERTIGY